MVGTTCFDWVEREREREYAWPGVRGGEGRNEEREREREGLKDLLTALTCCGRICELLLSCLLSEDPISKAGKMEQGRNFRWKSVFRSTEVGDKRAERAEMNWLSWFENLTNFKARLS